MNNTAEIATTILIHDLINTYLFPDRPMVLGEKDGYIFRDATVSIQRSGNRYGVSPWAATYKYRIKGDGFSLSLRSVWEDGGTTGRVSILEISPADSAGYDALSDWLRTVDDQAVAA